MRFRRRSMRAVLHWIGAIAIGYLAMGSVYMFALSLAFVLGISLLSNTPLTILTQLFCVYIWVIVIIRCLRRWSPFDSFNGQMDPLERTYLAVYPIRQAFSYQIQSFTALLVFGLPLILIWELFWPIESLLDWYWLYNLLPDDDNRRIISFGMMVVALYALWLSIAVAIRNYMSLVGLVVFMLVAVNGFGLFVSASTADKLIITTASFAKSPYPYLAAGPAILYSVAFISEVYVA